MRAATQWIMGALVLSGCSTQAPEPPQVAPQPQSTSLAKVPVIAQPPAFTPPAPTPPQKFVGVMKTESLVALTDAGAEAPIDPVRAAVEAQTESALDCLTGGEKKGGNVWFVARIATSGALEDLRIPTSDATDVQSKCLIERIGKVNFGKEPTALAVSFSLSFRPDNVVAQNTPTAPTPPKATNDTSDVNANGNMWGDSIGDSFGQGGLGLSGIGESAGGGGEGIGLGSIGTLGHGSGKGSGQGFGNGHGKLGGKHGKPPSIRMGATSVSGRLPPEVIQRIVRQNFGRFRLCYELGLQTDPTLAGKVAVAFVIQKDGSVDHPKHAAGTDLNDKNVVDCVVRSFGGLSFPQPEGGIVNVVYPIMFSNGDASAKPSKPAPRKAFTVRTKKMGEIDADTIAHALKSDTQSVESVVLADATAASPFVVFVRRGDEVYAVRRLKANAKGFVAASSSSERIAPDNWVLRVEGPDSLTSHDLMTALIDS